MLQKHYQRLGLKRGASKDKIKKAYRQKAKLFHPDRNKHPSAEQKFINLNLSYEILMDYQEGGAPTYKTTTNSVNPEAYKQTTYYQNTRFTIAEMEAAWERQRVRERKEYEDYLNLPWYSPIKLVEYLLHGCVGLVFLFLLLPLFLLGIGLIFISENNSEMGGIVLLLMSTLSTYAIYKGYKKD